MNPMTTTFTTSLARAREGRVRRHKSSWCKGSGRGSIFNPTNERQP
jgi:hypothetical protein